MSIYVRNCWFVIISTGLLGAADPSWKNKPVQQWDEEDAKQVLTSSPWVSKVVPVELPELTPEQRRDGGATGGGRGTGLGGVDGAVFTPGAAKTPAPKRYPGALLLRWESAAPIRVAEIKAHELGAPDWEGDYYVLAVYHVPDSNSSQKIPAGVLKGAAWLKREGKKDLKPARVEILQEQTGSSIVVYLFPRSEAITKEDGRLEFVAQIGRLSLAQYFYPEEMQFQGKLEL
jgi:hypothetical protein